MNGYYFDNAATMQVSPILRDVLNKYYFNEFGNPSSSHKAGQIADDAIMLARRRVAKFINAEPSEIIFTSGGSESNNLAIKGYAVKHKCSIITTEVEHKSVLKACDFLDENMYMICDYLGVDKDGEISLNMLDMECRSTVNIYKKTPFVSIQMANNETGTIQDIEKISEIVHKYNGVLHVDAVQAFGTLPIDVKKMGIDMMSASGHKIGTPKGIGFLYKKRGIQIEPLIHGGGQEMLMRSGTENVAGIVALGEMVNHFSSIEDYFYRKKLILMMARNFIESMLLEIPDSRINGAYGTRRLPGHINVSFKGIEGEALMLLLNNDGIYVSNGSACNSGSQETSYVLRAMRVPDDYINGTIRITISYDQVKELDSCEDLMLVVTKIKHHVEKLREAVKIE